MCLQVVGLGYPACLIRRSFAEKGVKFQSGTDEIRFDFISNAPLVDYILSLRAPLAEALDDNDLAESDESDVSDADDDVVFTVRRRPGLRRALRYDEADKEEWLSVPEGRDSWQQFFSDSQVAKLMTESIAIFSAYDHNHNRVRKGKFKLCFKVDGVWRCRCPDFAVRETCVGVLAAAHLERKKEKPLFVEDERVFEVEPGILWVAQDVGVSYQPVYQRADGTVYSSSRGLFLLLLFVLSSCCDIWPCLCVRRCGVVRTSANAQTARKPVHTWPM